MKAPVRVLGFLGQLGLVLFLQPCSPFTPLPPSRSLLPLHLPLRSSLLDDMPTINTDLLSEKDKSLLDALRSRSLNDDDASTIESMTLLPAGRDLPPLPDTFNPEYLAAVFGPRPLTCLTRILQIGGTLLPVLPSLVGAAVAGSLSSPATQASLAAEFREALTTLGPFFIKAGQALSIRPDILPPAGMVEVRASLGAGAECGWRNDALWAQRRTREAPRKVPSSFSTRFARRSARRLLTPLSRRCRSSATRCPPTPATSRSQYWRRR